MKKKRKWLFVLVPLLLLCMIALYAYKHRNQNDLLFPIDNLNEAVFIYTQAKADAIIVSDEETAFMLANFFESLRLIPTTVTGQPDTSAAVFQIVYIYYDNTTVLVTVYPDSIAVDNKTYVFEPDVDGGMEYVISFLEDRYEAYFRMYSYDVTANPPLDEDSLNAAVPDFLDEDQQLLYRRARCVYNHLFGPSTEDFDYWTEGDDHYFYAAGDLDVNGISYARCRGRYSNWADFDAMVRSIFTDGCWTTLNGDRYVNVDGTLYFAYGDRGSYYYNRRFPDTFTLVSKTDDEIVFTLTGHYSSPWPNEGESFEERDHRLESGWDYTYDFPIRMVRTEDGWRFDTFHAALADQVAPEEATLQAPGLEPGLSDWEAAGLTGEAGDAFAAVLKGGTYRAAATGEDLFINQWTEGGTVFPARPRRYTLVDLDGDGHAEVVVQMDIVSTDRLVLRWEDGIVVGYNFYLRGMNKIWADGTFSFASSAFDFGIGRLSFEDLSGLTNRDSYSLVREVLHCEAGTCYHEGEAVTQEKFDALLAAHDAQPLALWYEL